MSTRLITVGAAPMLVCGAVHAGRIIAGGKEDGANGLPTTATRSGKTTIPSASPRLQTSPCCHPGRLRCRGALVARPAQTLPDGVDAMSAGTFSGSSHVRGQGLTGRPHGATGHGLTRLAVAAATSTILLALAPSAALAGTVIVHFIKPSQYTDIGQFDSLQKDPLAELQRYLVSLGERLLPENQVLTVNFLEIDLAGTSRPTRGGAANVRLMRSAGDAPYLTLEYRLDENGHLIASGKQDLTDLQFLYHYRGSNQETSYPYEKRLLAQWFQNTFRQAGVHPHRAATPD